MGQGEDFKEAACGIDCVSGDTCPGTFPDELNHHIANSGGNGGRTG